MVALFFIFVRFEAYNPIRMIIKHPRLAYAVYVFFEIETLIILLILLIFFLDLYYFILYHIEFKFVIL